MIPLDANWNDLGGWNSIWNSHSKDENGNSSSGKVIIEDCKDCYVRSESRLIVGMGLKELIVVETNDALLISDKEKSQNVKKIVEELKIKGIQEGVEHKRFTAHGAIIYPSKKIKDGR